MLVKTRGIVFKYIRYKDTSIICKIFTEEFGLKSYLVNGVRSKPKKGSPGKMAFFQPLTLLELVVYHRENQNISRISELKCLKPLNNIPCSIKKTSQVLFITELLIKSIEEGEADLALFEFLFEAVEYLEDVKVSFENFHLYFMLSLSRFLGFAPASGKQLLQELASAKIRSIEFKPEWIDHLMDPTRFSIPLGRDQRNQVLEIMTSYYRIHIENLSEFRSVKVLNEVFNQ